MTNTLNKLDMVGSGKVLCIYHGNCADGFGAAWIVRKALQEKNIDFFPGVYQMPPPDVTGREVILVDFSYKRPVLLAMAAKARGILIIDHHKTAQEDLVDLPSNVKLVFDVEHSGAMLTWMHFFPGWQVPKLIEHIEDRDLWRFKLPRTREIQANVFSFPYDFAVWDDLMKADLYMLALGGESIERKHFKDITELLGVVTRPMCIGGVDMFVANLPYTLTSDAGHQLGLLKPHGAGGCYWDTPDGRIFSLRSTEEGIDVSAIAKQYGGGGHAHASGFKVSFEKAQEFEVKR